MVTSNHFNRLNKENKTIRAPVRAGTGRPYRRANFAPVPYTCIQTFHMGCIKNGKRMIRMVK